jgi:hypothetical protein
MKIIRDNGYILTKLGISYLAVSREMKTYIIQNGKIEKLFFE